MRAVGRVAKNQVNRTSFHGVRKLYPLAQAPAPCRSREKGGQSSPGSWGNKIVPIIHLRGPKTCGNGGDHHSQGDSRCAAETKNLGHPSTGQAGPTGLLKHRKSCSDDVGEARALASPSAARKKKSQLSMGKITIEGETYTVGNAAKSIVNIPLDTNGSSRSGGPVRRTQPCRSAWQRMSQNIVGYICRSQPNTASNILCTHIACSVCSQQATAAVPAQPMMETPTTSPASQRPNPRKGKGKPSPQMQEAMEEEAPAPKRASRSERKAAMATAAMEGVQPMAPLATAGSSSSGAMGPPAPVSELKKLQKKMREAERLVELQLKERCERGYFVAVSERRDPRIAAT